MTFKPRVAVFSLVACLSLLRTYILVILCFPETGIWDSSEFMSMNWPEMPIKETFRILLE